MRPNSIVERVSEFSSFDIRLASLRNLPIPQKHTPYVVNEVMEDGDGMYITLEEFPNDVYYLAKLFRELLPPEDGIVEEIIEEEAYA